MHSAVLRDACCWTFILSPILFIDPQGLPLTISYPYPTCTSVLARGPGVPQSLDRKIALNIPIQPHSSLVLYAGFFPSAFLSRCILLSIPTFFTIPFGSPTYIPSIFVYTHSFLHTLEYFDSLEIDRCCLVFSIVVIDIHRAGFDCVAKCS